MKTIVCYVIGLILLFLNFTAEAQTKEEEEEEMPSFMNMSRYNFNEIQRKADKYFSKELKREAKKTKEKKEIAEDSVFFSQTPNQEGRPEDNAYHKYKRWEWYWRDRINPDGSFHDITDHKEEYLKLQKEANGQIKTSPLKTAALPNWVNINQTSADGGYNGMGRAVALAFHPTDANTYFVGTPIGGIWKSTNGGVSYAPLTDALPYVSAGSIVVNYKKPSIIYTAVGSSEGWWNWSIGIYKSYDGGNNWSVTGLNWAFTNYRAIRKIVMSPTDTSILFAATTNGLYRSINSGASWAQIRTGHHTDVIYKPNNNVNDGNILYASTDAGDIYRSTDAGATWTAVYTSGGNGVHLSVTAADPNTIAASYYGPSTVVYSRDLGVTFTAAAGGITQNPDIFFVSQINANVFYYGGVDVFKSTNAGASWTQITHWCCPGAGQTEVHADNHAVAVHPLTPNVIYFGNDGGVYKYDENTQVWTERTAGLITTQYYRIATAQNNAVVLIGGTQDNGGRYRQSNGVWRASNGGDAMEQAIDPTNFNYMYSTYVNGQLYRTTNAWGGFTEITPGFSSGTREVGDWVAPYLLDPNNSATIVAGYKDVWRSTDRGTNWTKISNNLTGGNNLNQLAVTPGNSNIIYASEGTRLWRTTDGGTNWTQLTVPDAAVGTDPWGSGAITSIVISNTNQNNIWISRSGYNASVKVYASNNQGASWTNISTGLPNVPANTLIYENNTNDAIYVGTDAGVFYRNNTLGAWQYFGQGLPNTAVTDLAIQYSSGKIRAGTHGRGVWETDVVGLPVVLISFTAKINPDQRTVLVEWATASEKNNQYFFVERSDNGIDFTTVGKVSGKGNSSAIEHYSFTDMTPGKGKKYYRLTQVDFDGESDQSQIVSVNLSDELEVKLQPTLFHDYIDLQINSEVESALVEITDLEGKNIFKTSVNPNIKVQIGSGLSRGVYFVKVTANGKKEFVTKIVKQ